jgi:hypothetical protein
VRSLSSSDALRALIEDAKALSHELAGADPLPAELAEADLAGLLGVVVQLYAQLAGDPYDARRLAAINITPTDACTVAAALLRSQSLTPFEFSIWFGGGRVAAR